MDDDVRRKNDQYEKNVKQEEEKKLDLSSHFDNSVQEKAESHISSCLSDKEDRIRVYNPKDHVKTNQVEKQKFIGDEGEEMLDDSR
jgi:hypothetical protein